MKIVFLFGSTAVGKMTVGQELIKVTNLRLYHTINVISCISEKIA